MFRVLRGWLAAMGVLAGFGVLVVPAAGQGIPWWQLSTSARPTDLPVGGSAVQAEQELTVHALKGFFFVENPENKESDFLPKLFGGPPPYPLAFDASGGELRGVLEGLYGPGNVQVSEGVGDTAETHSWKIKFINAGPVALLVAGSDPAVAFEGKTGLQLEETTPGSGVFIEGTASVTQLVEGALHEISHIVVQAANLGDVQADGECVEVAPETGRFTNAQCTEEAVAPAKGNFEEHTISIADVVPAGMRAVSIEGAADVSLAGSSTTPVVCSVVSLTCTFVGVVSPFSLIEVDIGVIVEAGAAGDNVASVSGGGARSVSDSWPVKVVAAGVATLFGVENFEARPEEEGGAPDTQAGSHPYQITFAGAINENAHGEPAALPHELVSKLPPGLIGNPSAIKTCPLGQFFANGCPADTVVGATVVTIREPAEFTNAKMDEVGTFTLPVVNLEAQHGEAARFAFNLSNIAPVFLDVHVRTGEDYGVTAGSTNISQLIGLLGFRVTFWGVPGDERHNTVRTLNTFGGPLAESEPPPFLSLPTQCESQLHTSLTADSWIDQVPVEYAGQPMARMDGCNHLAFDPSIKVTPDSQEASRPTGLNVDVHVNQTSVLNANGLAESNVRDIEVALPQGVAVNPSSGNGLEACSEGLVGFKGEQEFPLDPGIKQLAFTPRLPGSIPSKENSETQPLEPGVDFCANASKIATVKIKSPLLPAGQYVEGGVYIASQNENPFGSLLAMYIVAEDPISGTVVKLAGDVQVSETGQLITTVQNNPQLAFEDAELHFFGGERAPLASPAICTAYTTHATFTPWSGNQPVQASSTFNITSGPNATACPGSTLAFSPFLTGGSTNINAGAFSPLTTTIAREDGQQNLQAVKLTMPEGLSGILTGVTLCPETQANEGTCGPESQIGETTVAAGVGSDPVSVKGGKVYITETYAGAPFGLSIVNPVKAGPFDLEHDTSKANQQPPCDCVVVRAKIEVNPLTAQLTVTTDPTGPHSIPHLIDGIPVQIQKVNVLINREHFTFNPTNCNPMALTATITSDENATQPLSVPFQATNCATLAFNPKLTVSTTGKTSKADGASLTAKIVYPPTPPGNQATSYAGIAKAKVDLPKQLPSRLTTLQKACLAAIFETNPTNCPPQSIVGHAKVITPLLPVPLQGPAYLVSHGNEAFPALTMVLKGYGITIELIGSTFIKKGITSTTFKTTPDAPLTSFELTLPQGPYSALAANGNLCTTKLNMPTAFTAQNGQEIHQTTPITVTGCTKPTKLATTLKNCRKKHNHKQRTTCEQQARKHNTTKTTHK